VEHRLRQVKMTPEAFVESSRMASTTLSTNELLRRVKGTVGKAYYTVPVPMHPNQGYVSLVSFELCFCFHPFFFISFYFFHPFAGATRMPNRPASGPRGRGRSDGASVGQRGKKRKKDIEKKRAREKRVACDVLEKHSRTQEREGVSLEPSPIIEDDDDEEEEGMEVQLGFSLEVRLWSEPTSVGPSSGEDVPTPRATASLSAARVLAEPGPTPVGEEEAAMVEKADVPLQVPIVGPKGSRSRGPRLAGVPRFG
jgi:hypothetical protein